MSETNKVILAAVLGILVGFGGGRLLENRSAGSDVKSAEESTETATTQTAETKTAEVTPAPEATSSEKAPEKAVDTSTPVSAATEATPATETPAAAASVSAGDQKAGTIVLASYTVPSTSWVVVHEDRAGKPGNVLGARRVMMGSGSTEVMLLRDTVAGGKYYAMLHADDGDGMFDLKKDMPIMNAGAPVMAMFKAQ